VPDELEHLGGSDERRADPQTKLTADVTDQRCLVVLRALGRHEHLSAVATPRDYFTQPMSHNPVFPLFFPSSAHRILFCILTLKSVLEVIFTQ